MNTASEKATFSLTYYLHKILWLQENFLLNLTLNIQTAAMNPKLLKWCAPIFLSSQKARCTSFTQLFDEFPRCRLYQITPSQNFRLNNPSVPDCHKKFWFWRNSSNFTYPLQLFTKEITVQYKFASLSTWDGDNTECEKPLKLYWSLNEVQENTYHSESKTLYSPFSHFQCKWQVSPYLPRQERCSPVNHWAWALVQYTLNVKTRFRDY